MEVAETQVVLDVGGRFARFRVAGNTTMMEDDVSNFSYSFYLHLWASAWAACLHTHLPAKPENRLHKQRGPPWTSNRQTEGA